MGEIMNLDDCSKLLAAYDQLYYDCRCLDHMHPPTVLLPAMREIWTLKQETGYDSQAPAQRGEE